MKVERIELLLNHYIDKDFECKCSQLMITKTINGKTKVVMFSELDAEALFSLVNDITEKKKEVQDENDSEAIRRDGLSRISDAIKEDKH